MKICGAVLPHNLVFLGHRERCIHMSLPCLDSQMVTSLFSFFLIKTREAILPHRPSYPLAQREDLVFSRHRQRCIQTLLSGPNSQMVTPSYCRTSFSLGGLTPHQPSFPQAQRQVYMHIVAWSELSNGYFIVLSCLVFLGHTKRCMHVALMAENGRRKMQEGRRRLRIWYNLQRCWSLFLGRLSACPCSLLFNFLHQFIVEI